MARPLIEFTPPADEADEEVNETWLTRTTARAFAAAVSALLIATLVVNRSGDALATDGTVSGSALTSGTISLVDDDSGRSLFDLSDMAPGRPVERCLQVVYEGSIVPVDLILAADASGRLGEFLDLSIEEGVGGTFESCDDFVATGYVYQGTLSDLATGESLDLGRILNTGEGRTYRFAFDLRDEQDALGLVTTADFVWEVTPS